MGMDVIGRSWYKLDLENIETFIAFLENCGGFQIC